MRGVARNPVPPSIAALLAIPLLFSAVLATGFQVAPASTSDGNPVSITLSNVTDGYDLNTTLVFTFPVTSPDSWLNITGWMNAFSLTDGNVTVTGENVNLITPFVRAGSTLRSTSPQGGTGYITLLIPMDLPADTYLDYRIRYVVHNTSLPLTLVLTQQGIKAGADDSVSTPTITGVGEGNMTVEVTANGALLPAQVVRFVSAVPTPAATLVTPQVTPSPAPTAAPTTMPTLVATTREATLPSTPVTPVQGTPVPVPGPEGPSPGILGYAIVILIIAILGDYILLKD